MYQLIYMNKIQFVNIVGFAWSFSFGQCIVCTSSTYGFELHFWYLQIFLDIGKMFQKGHFRFKIINNHNICQILKLEETTGIVIDIIVCFLDLHLPMQSLTIIRKVEKVKFLQMAKCIR
jgi:hypothetical protein